MHLSEGVLHSSTSLIGAVVAVLGLAIGLKKMTSDKLAITALFSSAFFVASTIHIPVGIGSVHLILNGIAGLFLGWRVFPAFLIALTLQALMFSFGGLAVLPAVVVRLSVFPWLKANVCRQRLIVSGILSGVIGVGGAALLASLVLAFDGSNQYHDLISLLLVSHLPVFVVDSLISVGVLLTLAKMLPSAFENAE